MNRLLFAGTGSGCGKTTVTCAFLSACKGRGLSAASFKCGPDYIDTLFHREITGRCAHNLDPYFCGPEALREQFLKGRGRDVSVIEGVMGYYDGIGATDEASAYTVARVTETPVVLVVNGRSIGNSAGAIIKGFCDWRRDSGIRGVIFNHVSQRRYEALKAIAAQAGVQAFGFLPYDAAVSIESRRLGLVPPTEVEKMREKILRLGAVAAQTLDVEALLALSKTAPPITATKARTSDNAPPIAAAGERAARENAPCQEPSAAARPKKKLRLAVARDEAFCFHYAENLECLEFLGAEIAYFSPMHDRGLPDGIGGLYLGGGWPERHAEQLAANAGMLAAIRSAVESGLPTLAESGGFLLLQETLDGFPMAGALPGCGFQTDALQRFGYAELTARVDNLLCAAGQKIRARSFHYMDSDNPGDAFTAHKAGAALTYRCGHATDTLYAGFPQFYFPGNPEVARRFVRKAEGYAG